jgi:hypothetical protein
MDPLAPGLPDEKVQVRKESDIGLIPLQAASRAGIFLKNVPRAVSRTVIADDELEVVKILCEDGLY